MWLVSPLFHEGAQNFNVSSSPVFICRRPSRTFTRNVSLVRTMRTKPPEPAISARNTGHLQRYRYGSELFGLGREIIVAVEGGSRYLARMPPVGMTNSLGTNHYSPGPHHGSNKLPHFPSVRNSKTFEFLPEGLAIENGTSFRCSRAIPGR